MAKASADATSMAQAGPALLGLGFRPFYLLAGLFAVFAIPLWVASYIGLLPLHGYLSGLAWHQHEMLFGFGTAVIAGFLLTAVRNWTGLATPTGLRLGALATVWILGRVLAFTGPALPAIAFDLAFVPILAAVIAVPIWRSRNKRNVKLLFVLAALTVANAVYHLAYIGVIDRQLTLTASTVALDVVTILIAIMSGRVIPAFIGNAISSASPRRSKELEFVAIVSLLLVLIVDALAPFNLVHAKLSSALFFVAALAHGVRLWLWDPHRTYSNALLMMLPVAYAWIPIMLVLRGLAALDVLPATAAVHALTIGGMASLMLAMMMRSALGHTGRALKADATDIAAFVLLQIAAITRMTATLVAPTHYREWVMISGAFWVLAFVVFLIRYIPMLAQARVDGRPG